MKNIHKIMFRGIIIGLICCLIACNEEEFLSRYPLATPNPENFFVNASTARLAVNACYDPWEFGGSAMFERDMVILMDAITDDSYWRPSRSTSIALELWNFNPTHGNIEEWWDNPFQCINAANFAIDNIPLSSDQAFTPDQQIPFIAEARFFRAYSYLFLTTFYGDVPLFTSAASDFSQFNTPRTPKADVLAQVIEDFTFAKDNLPATQNDFGPPTSGAAGAYLAKTYLFLNEWDTAETAAREAIQIAEGAGYQMIDDYPSIWTDEGNSEILFAWTFVENDPDYGQNMTVQRLSRDLPSTLRVAIGGDGWGYALPQRDLYDAYEEGDPRREFTIYSPGHDYEIYPGPEEFAYTHETYNENGEIVSWDVTYQPGDMVEYDYRWSPTGMNVRKMTNSVKDIANVRWDGMDVPQMRMAELYLILAEALAEQGKAEALQWVNKVRSRPSVNMPPKSAADGNLVDIVRHERRVELAMEGLRIYDLIRWGIVDEVFGEGNKVKRNFFSDYLPEGSSLKFDSPIGKIHLDPLFPIPQEEIDQNSEINTNNPGW